MRHRDRLTEKQRQVLASIERLTLRCQRPPSVRVLCGVFGNAPNCIQGHIKTLVRKGFLRRAARGKQRALTIDRRIDGADVLVRGRWVPLLAVEIAGEAGTWAWKPEGVGQS